ncbi:MAG: membrane protein insertase YidC [Bacteroidota bacterium]
MEKNQLIGIVLMFALLAVYFTFFAPEPPVAEEPTQEVPVEQVEPQNSPSTNQLAQEKTAVIDSAKLGAFTFAAAGEETLRSFENDELLITFSSKGGLIHEVVLKNHKDYLGQPLQLVDPDKSSISLMLPYQNEQINLAELAFTSSSQKKGDTVLLLYSLKSADFSIVQEYTIPPTGVEIGYELRTTGLSKIIDNRDATLAWAYDINRTESNLEDSRRNSNLRFKTLAEDYDELDQTSEQYEQQSIAEPLNWIAFKQKFFTTGIIAKSSFAGAVVEQKVDPNDTSVVKSLNANIRIPGQQLSEGFGYKYYFGTNRYSILKKVAPEFEENLDMGWGPLPVVNIYLIIPIFHFLERFFTNYGVIIMIIVIIIRLILSPLTYKSHMSMAKMRVMKPELDEIKEKHDGDMQKAQQEQMKLYQQVGINPLSGCIPMLLQMPILFALFFFFPNAVELRQQSFLWAHDLSTYDSIINLPFTIPFYGNHVSLFTLLMTLSTILYTWSNSQITTVQGPMQTLQYIMPVMFLFVLNSYASGLTFYYFVSNMATFGQTVLFRKFIDEDKIHSVLQENKKKNANKKKSKFQTKLEEAMKASQEAQRQKKKKK